MVVPQVGNAYRSMLFPDAGLVEITEITDGVVYVKYIKSEITNYFNMSYFINNFNTLEQSRIDNQELMNKLEIQ